VAQGSFMPESFIELCTALRKLGATHVKHGAFEASFAGVMGPPVTKERMAARVVDEDKLTEALRRDELSRV